MPTNSELRLIRRTDSTFPDGKVFERFGPKAAWPSGVASYCRERPEDADVLAIVTPLIVEDEAPVIEPETEAGEQFGFVYLLRSGRNYKIGYTLDPGRRRNDIGLLMPDPVEEVHVIRTDDPVGIERYWHRRFAARRKKGEWFALTRADIAAFKRPKFM